MLIAFHLGRVYTLSLAELLALFKQKQVEFSIKELYTEILIIETHLDLDLESLQRRLGGIVKIIEVVDVLPRKKNSDYLSFTVKDYFHPNIIKSHYLKPAGGKVQFGISIYQLSDKLKLYGQNKRIGMEIKKSLQEIGISCRLVIPEGSSLSLPSVTVGNNQLLTKGAEIDLLVSQKSVYLGKTATIQDFADYGRRDYQRPVRDARIGMIPPKVAQAMINLAAIPDEIKESSAYLLDPFCGGGTILQEAILMGYHVLGTDISPAAIDAAEKNLNWFRTRYKLPLHRFELLVADATQLREAIAKKTLSGVITEGTLGPAYATVPKPAEMEKNFSELSKLYQAFFTELKVLLPSGSLVVIALPAYQKNDGYISFPDVDKILAIGYSIQELIPNELKKQFPFLQVTPRNSIIYHRKDQIVVREIIIFKAN